MTVADGSVVTGIAAVGGSLVGGLQHGRLRPKQGGIEADGLGEVLDGDVDVQVLHSRTPYEAWGWPQQAARLATAASGAQTSGRPWQQSSIRKTSSSLILS
jgi:hypothetical protein